MFDPIFSTSLQYIPVDVAEMVAGVLQNPTNDTVRMAFVAPDAIPADVDFNNAVWETDTTSKVPVYTALCLVGPGGDVQLTSGEYRVCVKITDNPEVPVLKVPGLLTVL